MKDWTGKLVACAMIIVALTGCTNMGSAPGAQTGSARSESEGEFYHTETIAPGVGSALFPDPGWR